MQFLYIDYCPTKNHDIHDYWLCIIDPNGYWLIFIQISWLLALISTRLLQFSIIDEQKNDDDTIIAIKNIDINLNVHG